MMTSTRTYTVLEAHRWHRNGDHPRDRVGEQLTDLSGVTYRREEGAVVGYYREPADSALTRHRCLHCEALMHEHGWLDAGGGAGEVVCPGDWIIAGDSDNDYHACKPELHALLARHRVVAQP